MSLGVPAKPVIAKDFIEADNIGRKAVADFIDSLLVKKICLLQPDKMLQAYKVLRLARSSKKRLSNLQNEISQLRAQRSVFGQHDILSIGHNVDFELTLPFLLGPVPLSLSTPDRISTKTDKSDFRMACNHTLNQHFIGHAVLHIHVTLMVMP